MARPRKYGPEVVDRVLTLYARGCTYEEMVAQTGIPYRSLQNIIRREGVAKGRRRGRFDKYIDRAVRNKMDDMAIENERLRTYVKKQREQVSLLQTENVTLRARLAEAEWRLEHPDYTPAL